MSSAPSTSYGMQRQTCRQFEGVESVEWCDDTPKPCVYDSERPPAASQLCADTVGVEPVDGEAPAGPDPVLVESFPSLEISDCTWPYMM